MHDRRVVEALVSIAASLRAIARTHDPQRHDQQPHDPQRDDQRCSVCQDQLESGS